jgi:PAS domain-containing protein
MPIFMAGIAFYVAVNHFLIYTKLRKKRVNLSFALLCFLIGIYDLLCAGLYNADSVAIGGLWERYQLVVIELCGAALLLFIFDYTSYRSKKALYLWIGYFLIIALVGLLERDGWLLNLTKPSIKQITLAGQPIITYYELASGPLNDFAVGPASVLVYCYLLAITIRYSRNGHQKEARPLIIGLTAFFIGIANDAAVSTGLYQFIYLIEYCFIGMVILMTLTLTGVVVETVRVKVSLQTSEKRLETASREGRVALWEWNITTGVLEWSPIVDAMLGYDNGTFPRTIAA